ncbi:MAG: hypothetical protein Q9167_004861 [Letrouitia subvulpina]
MLKPKSRLGLANTRELQRQRIEELEAELAKYKHLWVIALQAQCHGEEHQEIWEREWRKESGWVPSEEEVEELEERRCYLWRAPARFWEDNYWKLSAEYDEIYDECVEWRDDCAAQQQLLREVKAAAGDGSDDSNEDSDEDSDEY